MPGLREPAGHDVRKEYGEGDRLQDEGLPAGPSLHGVVRVAGRSAGAGAALRRYSVAVALIFLALSLRFALDGILGDKAVYVTFLIAVAITSGYGGLGPALVATILGGLSATLFFVAPDGQLADMQPSDQMNLGMYILVCVTFAVVGEARQRALRRAKETASELEQTISERIHAEQTRRESEERFRTMADAAPVLIWVSGEDKGGVFFNKPWLDFTGRTLEEELGEKWLENIHPDDLPALQACADAFAEQRPFTTQFRLRRHDGIYRWMLDTGVPLKGADGSFQGFIGTCVDITDRIEAEQGLRERVEEVTTLYETGKRAEEALRRSEERFRLALSGGAVTAYQQDLNLNYIWLHPPELYEASMGKTDAELVSDKTEAEALESVKRRVLQTQEGERQEVKVTLRGEAHYYDLIVEPMYGPDGKLSGVGGAALDITERKRFEEALFESREAERRFQEQLTALHLVEDELSMAPTVDKICRLAVTLAHSRLGFDRIAVWLAEGDGRIRGTYGIDESGLVRPEHDQVLEVSPESSVGQVLKGGLQTICREDAPLYDHRGEVVGRGVHCAAALWDGVKVIGCVVSDNLISQEPINEQRRELLNLFATNLGHLCSRKQVEEALRESDDRYRSFVEQSTEAIWRVELEHPIDISLPIDEQIELMYKHGYLAECNDAMAQMYGFLKAEQIVGARMADLLVKDDPANVQYLRTFIEANYRLNDAESVERDSAGNAKYFINNLVGIIEDGKVVRAWGTQRDVTERRRIEEELRESEGRLSLALSAGRMGIWDWNVATNELTWSRDLEPIHGFEPGTFDGRFESFEERIYQEDRVRVRHEVSEALATGGEFSTEFRVLHPDGSIHWVAGKGRAFKDEEGKPVRMLGVGLDITAEREAQEELRVSEERFRRMVDQSPLSVQIMSADGRTVSVNKAWEDLWGATLEMMEGYNMLEDQQLEERGIMPYIKQAFDGEPAQIPATPYTPPFGKYAGQERWSRAFIYPVRAGNKIREVVLIHEDITERRNAEEALKENEQRFRLIFETSMYPILIADDEGRYVDANEAACELIGVDKEQLLRMRVADLKTTGQADAAERYSKYVESGSEIGEFEFIRPDGQERIVEYSASRFAPGLHLSILRDITARKAAEEEIRQLNSELEQRVEQRTAQLSAANRELEGFSYSVSHDLRTPLRSISGFSKVLLDDYGDKLDEEAKDYLRRIMNAGFRMTDMIDDLLAYSRLGRREMKVDRVDLSHVAQDVVAEIKRRHPDTTATFRIEPNLIVQADPQLLRVVMENLLDNAFKFASKAAEPVIEFGSTETEVGRAFFVRDNGIGFDPQYLGKLFQPFERLHRNTDYPGTGIGLANVQRIIHRHDGKVWAEGEVGRGATFYFTLGKA